MLSWIWVLAVDTLCFFTVCPLRVRKGLAGISRTGSSRRCWPQVASRVSIKQEVAMASALRLLASTVGVQEFLGAAAAMSGGCDVCYKSGT